MIQTDNAMKETRVPIGSVVSLWRYPIKSMMGEELNSSYMTGRGLAGDRSYGLIDQETGKWLVPRTLENGESSSTFEQPLLTNHK